LIGKVRR
jgi:elongation factor Tu